MPGASVCRILLIVLLCALPGGIVLGADPQSVTDWPQLQRDAGRAGRTSVFVGPRVRARWVWVDEEHVTRNFQSAKGNRIAYPEVRELIIAGDVQPIVAEGKVFFGADDGRFFALNAPDATTAWKAQLDGAVFHTAAYGDGVVVVPCMDHNVYGLSAADGTEVWRVTTGAGVSAAPLIVNGTVFVGSRDGNFYAIRLADGNVLWTYRALAKDAADPFTGAAIVQPAASDGSVVCFGAENMYFYALDAQTGRELWRKQLRGQSFQYSWPVILDGKVLVPVMTGAGNAEFVTESELDALPNGPAAEVWPLEREAIRGFLVANPHQKSMYALDLRTGAEPFELPLGRVGGINYPPRAPVIYSDGRAMLYWRTKTATVLTGGTFGSKYTPDISAMDPGTGDRAFFTPPRQSGMGAEMDNNFTLTVGGDWVYMNNHMRGAHMINPLTGQASRLTSIMAVWDGGGFRGWGNQVIYLGNDDAPDELPPPSAHRSPQGDSGVVLVEVDGKPLAILSESGHYQIDFGAIVALETAE